MVGLCWTAGIDAALSGTASAAKRDYAMRVQNVYEARRP
jgi:hypothetical protein